LEKRQHIKLREIEARRLLYIERAVEPNDDGAPLLLLDDPREAVDNVDDAAIEGPPTTTAPTPTPPPPPVRRTTETADSDTTKMRANVTATIERPYSRGGKKRCVG
jgi:hypothetical protein